MSYTWANLNQPSKVIYTYIIGTPRNLLLGASLSYAIQKKLFIHIPIIFLFPSVYTGYQVYDNKEKIISWLHSPEGSD